MLIDFESIQPESVKELLQDHFSLLLFVGANQTKVSFELATEIQRMGSRAEYIKMSGNGPNALDFHIAFYIGQISTQDPTAYFHIISKDKGFDPLIQHLKSRKIPASRSEAISDIPIIKNSQTKAPEERVKIFVEKLHTPKATKPRTTKTLSSSIKALFQPSITDQEIHFVIELLQSQGHIVIKEGKVTYQNLKG